VAAAREFLDAHADEPVSLPRLARAVGLSPAYLQRTFTRIVGVSPKAYHDAHRRSALRAGLRRGETVTQASFAAGFGSASAAYRSGAAGVTPGEYRRGGRGLLVRYGVVPSSIGTVLVAATDRGVCAVLLGDSDAEVEDLLARELPLADRVRDDNAIAEWAGAVIQRIDGTSGPDVPLDLRGSDFQLRVWHALREIPRGETRSYAQLAASLGRPTAVRAVARACATNPAAVIVPCHRVISSSGRGGGYRWGVQRKGVLLEREKRTAR
jgi:AraC family transcriptional regulator of adaptative response/methylated-DNA-[protein]-cysteine methyltransferase